MLNLLEAMAAVESGGDPHARSNRNNNPGNINWGAFAQRHGADRVEIIPPGYHEDARFAHWPAIGLSDGSIPNTGYGAFKSLLMTTSTWTVINGEKHLVDGYAGSSIHQMLYKFAPPRDGNATSAYESRVCKLIGVTPDTIIDGLIANLKISTNMENG